MRVQGGSESEVPTQKGKTHMIINDDIVRRVLQRLAAEVEPAQAKRVIDVVNGGAGQSYDGLTAQQIPVKFAVGDVTMELPEGMADNEEIPEGIRRRYNKMLAQLGQSDMLLPEHGIHKLVRAHEWIWIKAGKPQPVAPKVRKAPQPRPETPRNWLWKGQPVTEAQYFQRLRMAKNVVPENSGRRTMPTYEHFFECSPEEMTPDATALCGFQAKDSTSSEGDMKCPSCEVLLEELLEAQKPKAPVIEQAVEPKAKAKKKAKKERKRLIAACEILGVPAEIVNAMLVDV